MTKLSFIGVLIQITGFLAIGCVFVRVLKIPYGFSAQPWDWLVITSLLLASRYLLREGLKITQKHT